MHNPPKPLFHRDIRWPNVVQQADDRSKWFLIDWEEAACSPTTAAMHLSRVSHCERVFHDNHTGEVDVWAVGNLAVEAFRTVVGCSNELKSVGLSMRSGELDAIGALRMVRALRERLD